MCGTSPDVTGRMLEGFLEHSNTGLAITSNKAKHSSVAIFASLMTAFPGLAICLVRAGGNVYYLVEKH
jgi:hypothetical protein